MVCSALLVQVIEICGLSKKHHLTMEKKQQQCGYTFQADLLICLRRQRGDKLGLTFHRFPADPERCSKRIVVVRWENWQPTQYMNLCIILLYDLCIFLYNVFLKIRFPFAVNSICRFFMFYLSIFYHRPKADVLQTLVLHNVHLS